MNVKKLIVLTSLVSLWIGIVVLIIYTSETTKAECKKYQKQKSDFPEAFHFSDPLLRYCYEEYSIKIK